MKGGHGTVLIITYIALCSGASNGPGDGRLLTVREEDMPPASPALIMNPTAGSSSSSQSPRPVVDLTEESKPPADDLQRAIELSLAEGAGTAANAFSQEEQDVSKALEASLLESSRSRRKTDSQNPHDKKRNGEVDFISTGAVAAKFFGFFKN